MKYDKPLDLYTDYYYNDIESKKQNTIAFLDKTMKQRGVKWITTKTITINLLAQERMV